MTNHIGEIQRQKVEIGSDRMIVCSQNDKGEVYVIFEADDNMVGPRDYDAFKNGSIRNTKSKPTYNFSDIVGEEIVLTSDLTAKCIKYTSDTDICIQLSDKTIVDHISIEDFLGKSFTLPAQYSTSKYLAERNRDRATRAIRDERNRTYECAVDLLNRFHKVAVVRPCGFGKTTLAKRLFKEYGKSLYLYPQADAEGLLSIDKAKSNDKSNKLGKVDTMTYVALARKTPEQLAKMNYDMIFMDEIQYLGAGKKDSDSLSHTYPAVKKLMELHPETKFVGATATPERMDGTNVIKDFFGNITVYPYTIEDALDDGLFTPPKYLYATYGIKELIKKTAKKIHKNVSKSELEEILGSQEVEKIDAENMDKAIVSAVNELNIDTDYMRYAVFYRTVKELQDNKDKVVRWFQKAFPDHDVYITEVHSKSEADIKTVRKLPTDKGRIDLVFSCEILNLGYHDEHITGLVLDRKTFSIQKYWQMIGRVFSMDTDKKAVIFDIADNLHSDFEKYVPSIAALSEADVKTISIMSPLTQKLTFASVKEANPYAIRWDKIAPQSKQKLVDIGVDYQDIPKERQVVPEISTDLFVEEMVAEETPTEKTREPHTYGPRGSYNLVKPVLAEPLNEESSLEELGYNSSATFTNSFSTGRLIKVLDIVNQQGDIEQFVKDKLIAPTKENAKIAVQAFREYCHHAHIDDNLFESYDEYLETSNNSAKRQIFDAAAWIGRLSPEELLKYTIEDKICEINEVEYNEAIDANER